MGEAPNSGGAGRAKQKIRELKASVCDLRSQISQLVNSGSATKRLLESAKGELHRRNVVEKERIAAREESVKRHLEHSSKQSM